MRFIPRRGALGAWLPLALGALGGGCMTPSDAGDRARVDDGPLDPAARVVPGGVFTSVDRIDVGIIAAPGVLDEAIPSNAFARTHKSFFATNLSAVNADAATPTVPYVGQGGAPRTCTMRATSTCQASTGGPANQPCAGTLCEALLLEDRAGFDWSEIWLQVESLPTGWVVSGDNRGMLAANDWRVLQGNGPIDFFHSSAVSIGAWRFGTIQKTLVPGTKGPDSIEVDIEFDYGPGIFPALNNPPLTVWGVKAPSGYTMSATTACAPIPVPGSGTTTIFSSANEAPHTTSVAGGLPFPFTLYGVTDTALWASYDGAYGLGAAPLAAGGPYGALPTATTTQGLILPQWANTQGKTAAPTGTVVGFPSPAASPTSYVIQATGVRWVHPAAVLLDYQIVLRDDGSIRFLYPGGTNVSGSGPSRVDHGSRSLTSGTTAQNVLLGAPLTAGATFGATIGLQGPPLGGSTPFTQYGTGGTVTGTGTGIAQQCYLASGAACGSSPAAPTLLPGTPDGGLLNGTSCFAIDFTPTY